MGKKKQLQIMNLIAAICGFINFGFIIPFSIMLSNGHLDTEPIMIFLSIMVSFLSICCLICGFLQIFNFSASHIPWLQIIAGIFNIFVVFVFLAAIFSVVLIITANSANDHYEMYEHYLKFENKENIAKKQRWSTEWAKIQQEKANEAETNNNDKSNNSSIDIDGNGQNKTAEINGNDQNKTVEAKSVSENNNSKEKHNKNVTVVKPKK